MTNDERSDRLADDAMIAIMRLLVHQAGGIVTGVDDEGDAYEAYDAEIVRMIERAAVRHRQLRADLTRAEGPERMLTQSDAQDLRRFLDRQWNHVRRTLDSLTREMDRRSPEGGRAGESGTPPLALD